MSKRRSAFLFFFLILLLIFYFTSLFASAIEFLSWAKVPNQPFPMVLFFIFILVTSKLYAVAWLFHLKKVGLWAFIGLSGFYVLAAFLLQGNSLFASSLVFTFLQTSFGFSLAVSALLQEVFILIVLTVGLYLGGPRSGWSKLQ